MMKTYIVGGYVRDTLLGLTPQDKDYVVVGATPEQMIELDFEKVGSSFPVFLKDGEEYALARTERKVAPGYNGFEVVYDPNVTLEDDLVRRDLTINSMAICPDTGEIIDPHNGRVDLEAGILRHTSEAFAEDPIRVLRTARFAARYAFTIHPDTIELMRKVAHELVHVPKERIWKEFEKGLMERNPALMLQALRQCGALDLDILKPFSGAVVNLVCADSQMELPTRFALIGSAFGDDDSLYQEYRVPNDCAKVCKTINRHFLTLLEYDWLPAEKRLNLLVLTQFLRDEWLMTQCFAVMQYYAQHGIKGLKWGIGRIYHDVSKIKQIDAVAIAKTCSTGPEIKQKIYEARLAAISQ